MNSFKDYLLETVGRYKRQNDPPAVLTMKRKSVRMFPDGSRVALYHIDKLNMDIPIPYATNSWKTVEK